MESPVLLKSPSPYDEWWGGSFGTPGMAYTPCKAWHCRYKPGHPHCGSSLMPLRASVQARMSAQNWMLLSTEVVSWRCWLAQLIFCRMVSSAAARVLRAKGALGAAVDAGRAGSGALDRRPKAAPSQCSGRDAISSVLAASWRSRTWERAAWALSARGRERRSKRWQALLKVQGSFHMARKNLPRFFRSK